MMKPFGTRTIEQAIGTLIDYRGKTPPKTMSGVWLITAKVIKEGFIQSDNKEFIAADFYDEWMRRGLPKQWDVLVTTEAPLGEVAQLRTQERVALAQRVILLRGNPDVVHQGYLYQAMKSDFVQGELKARASGTTVLGIKQSELWKVKIPWYPLPTQRKIASILSAYDDLIENNTRRIAILEEMAQAIYREWFVHFRFPGHENVPLVDSPLGKIPKGWNVATLSELCSRITDGAHRSPKSVESGKPMASMKDMDDWGLELSQCRMISNEDFEELVRMDCKPRVGDVLVAKDGASYLKYMFVVEKELDVVLLSSIAVLRPNGEILPHLMVFRLRDPAIKSRMAVLVTGAAIPRIILKDFAQFQIVVPDKTIQSQWWQNVEAMIDLIHNLRVKNANLRKARDLLLPKLITGQLDVEDLDIETGQSLELGIA